jgi:hypothetical protein
MATIPSFIFGGNTGVTTPDSANRIRATAQALMARMNTPRDVGEGLGAIGQAIMARTAMDRATRAEQEGQAQAAHLFAGLDDGFDQKELTGLLSDPWVAANPGMMKTAQALYERELQKSDPAYQLDMDYKRAQLDNIRNPRVEPTGNERDFGFLIDQGLDQKDALNRVYPTPTATTTINVGEGSSAYNKKLDELFAQRFIDTQAAGQSAQDALNSYSIMEQSLSDPNFYSGAAGDQVLAAKRFGAMLGLDPSGISSMESFNAMSKKGALDAMGGSLGTGFSNADRDFVMDQVPSLGNTPEGNKRLIEIHRKLAKRRVEIAQLATDYAKRNGQLNAGFDDELRAFAAANPLFPKDATAPAEGATGTPKPGTVEGGYRFKGGDPADPNNWEKV